MVDDAATPNACVTPDGTIFVMTGLLAMLADENNGMMCVAVENNGMMCVVVENNGMMLLTMLADENNCMMCGLRAINGVLNHEP